MACNCGGSRLPRAQNGKMRSNGAIAPSKPLNIGVFKTSKTSVIYTGAKSLNSNRTKI